MANQLTCTYIPSLSPQSMEFPVLYSRFSLIIYFVHSSSVHMWIESPNSALPLWYPYVCSPCLCLYFCFADRFICTVFLDSTYIYINIWYLFFFWLHSVWQFLGPSISLQMARFCVCLFVCLFVLVWVIFYCIYVPHLLYPFLCWWIFRLLPYPGYCKQCCNGHWGACIFCNYDFLCVYFRESNCWVIR